jgi:predicted DsbA family dithiol-disulfide isomerase
MTDRVAGIAAQVGLDYDYDTLQTTNTFSAHELLHFAKAHGKQLELKEALMRAYFVDGGHVGHVDDLVALAESVGLDADAARAALESHVYESDVRADIEQAAAYGITGVPFFVFEEKYGVSGAQESATFASVLTQLADERAKEMQR